ncbi:MAG: hypothetical protein J0647_04975 [Campylobacteraceae bacterium]|nr:hypothetical protein [Campylobacteraceae bacterium]
MTINADALMNQTMLNTLANTKEVPSTANFETELQRQLIDNLKSQQETTNVQTDAAVEDFKRELSSRGALTFLQEQNFEKIETLLEKKKQELMDSLGLGDSTQPPLAGEEKKTALQTLDSMLSDYKKQLLEEIQTSNKTKTNNTTLSSLLQNL